tara:strand:- start:319 stop:1506 length:1188 start_codon:yes stop_codon:yes gene_type:complete
MSKDNNTIKIKTKKTKNNEQDHSIITYSSYLKNENKNLNSYKQIILKNTCKHNKLKVTGKKSILIERIENYFKQLKNALIIQSLIRRKQWNIYYNKRGPGFKDRQLCSNVTDFVTLEPINEIELPYFFSYKDDNNFIYGFNICSLINLIRSQQKFINPYNRTPFNELTKKNIIKIYNNNFFINEKFKIENKYFSRQVRSLRYLTHTTNVNRNLLRNNHIFNTSNVDNYNPRIDPRRTVDITSWTHEQWQERIAILNTVRNQTILSVRTERLFIEIDNLGNYTNSSWFSNLTHMQYLRLYRCIYDIWSFRGQLSSLLKRYICPYHDPFEGIFPRYVQNNITIEQIKKACLLVFENLIYSSPDVEYRKIGALHCLCSLTIVSHNARLALPFLYESVA